MEMEIKSRKLNRTFTFWKIEGGDHFIYLVTPERPGILGRQICEGGTFYGHTISANDNRFKTACLKWYRARVRNVGEQ